MSSIALSSNASLCIMCTCSCALRARCRCQLIAASRVVKND
jgi:hypothetical protein